MIIDSSKLTEQEISLKQFAKSIAYHRTIANEVRINELDSNFIFATCTSHLLIATLEWTKVFGSYKEKIHWSQNLNNREEGDFREVLYRISEGKTEWFKNWREMTRFRNKIIAHTDLDDRPIYVPKFDIPKRAAEEYLLWIKQLAKANGLFFKPVDLDTYYDIAKDDCTNIINKLLNK